MVQARPWYRQADGGEPPPRLLCVEVSVAAALFLSMVQAIVGADLVDVARVVPELRADLWVFHAAACHFALQFLICGIVSMSLLSFHGSVRPDMTILQRLQEVSAMMCLSGFLTTVYYTHVSLSSQGHLGTIGWFQDVEEPRYIGRYLVWAISAPIQCIIVTRLCSTATTVELVGIAVEGAMVILLGFHAVAGHVRAVHGVLAPFQWHRLCIALACACSAVLFRRMRAVRPEPSLASAWKMGQAFLLFIWIVTPAVQLLRSFGLISARCEEVGFTMVDIIAKSLVALCAASASVVQNLAAIMLSARSTDTYQDLTLQLEHPGWRITFPRSGPDTAALERLMGPPREGLNFLEDLVEDEGQRQVLLQAAEVADGGGAFTAPKVKALLHFPNGQQAMCECVISRSFYGCRQVSVKFTDASPGAGCSSGAGVPAAHA